MLRGYMPRGASYETGQGSTTAVVGLPEHRIIESESAQDRQEESVVRNPGEVQPAAGLEGASAFSSQEIRLSEVAVACTVAELVAVQHETVVEQSAVAFRDRLELRQKIVELAVVVGLHGVQVI